MLQTDTILLTNDDGISAEGLQILAETLMDTAKIKVSAPDHERSACGHSITMHRPLRSEKAMHLYPPKVSAWAVNGTPADCVKLAVEALMKHRPRIVFSGINSGPNLGTDVLYSGTVSAALEAAMLGLPAAAVSLCTYGADKNYRGAAKAILKLLPFLLEAVPAGKIFNINIPALDEDKIKGVKFTRLGMRRYQNSFTPREDPRGRTYYWLAGELKGKAESGSDALAVEEGYISITPLAFDITDTELMNQSGLWMKKLHEEGIN